MSAIQPFHHYLRLLRLAILDHLRIIVDTLTRKLLLQHLISLINLAACLVDDRLRCGSFGRRWPVHQRRQIRIETLVTADSFPELLHVPLALLVLIVLFFPRQRIHSVESQCKTCSAWHIFVARAVNSTGFPAHVVILAVTLKLRQVLILFHSFYFATLRYRDHLTWEASSSDKLDLAANITLDTSSMRCLIPVDRPRVAMRAGRVFDIVQLLLVFGRQVDAFGHLCFQMDAVIIFSMVSIGWLSRLHIVRVELTCHPLLELFHTLLCNVL